MICRGIADKRQLLLHKIVHTLDIGDYSVVLEAPNLEVHGLPPFDVQQLVITGGIIIFQLPFQDVAVTGIEAAGGEVEGL